ncbi:hypothetical protein GLAREA_09339 [Glarea lozoyensis ATCC 20868]|uniref:Uncharacterized protein n=1 Tax=Glarea lozoyensis (strain ATCC 20868 / MF5171) TaxID=1116229 RepID=S3CT33_GLAL2|nr:uncharacterized protein GLAREA_09339 [Glarea lozoyensis ATCC 20868]EPE28219.1 hypothetical protein GLAREA_09339 [Glarea lozoyensis ATCC 20868]
MHFTTSIATVFASTLLLSLTIGLLSEDLHNQHYARGLSARAEPPKPKSPTPFSKKYCSDPLPQSFFKNMEQDAKPKTDPEEETDRKLKKDPKIKTNPKKKTAPRDIEKSKIHARGPVSVKMGSFIAQLERGEGLTSDGFGTCPGFAVVGTPAGSNKPARILYHMSLGTSNEHRFREFMDAIRTSGMTVTQGVMYTVDTRASNPENDDPDLAAESAASEATFEYRWWHFTRICSGQCIREYHPWGSRTTVLSISSSNVISTHHIM